jgi:V/A-type H+/Na+-transporting ATPase subunit F
LDLSGKSIAHSGKIAVVGDRELVLGYRLLGVEDAFVARREDSQKVLMDLFNSNDFGLIVAGDEVRKSLSHAAREKLEASIVPLVVFMPPLDSAAPAEESLSKLARRVLGVDLKVSA